MAASPAAVRLRADKTKQLRVKTGSIIATIMIVHMGRNVPPASSHV